MFLLGWSWASLKLSFFSNGFAGLDLGLSWPSSGLSFFSNVFAGVELG